MYFRLHSLHGCMLAVVPAIALSKLQMKTNSKVGLSIVMAFDAFCRKNPIPSPGKACGPGFRPQTVGTITSQVSAGKRVWSIGV